LLISVRRMTIILRTWLQGKFIPLFQSHEGSWFGVPVGQLALFTLGPLYLYLYNFHGYSLVTSYSR
jgi:hypothetical protein